MPFDQNDLPEWNASGTEPPQAHKDSGWGMSEHPPADWFNWLFNKAYTALKSLFANAQHKEEKGQANGYAALDANGKVINADGSLAGGVQSVNGKTGAVALTASDVGAETPTGAQTKVNQAIANLTNSAPGALDTLKELADALGDDPNFSTTILNRLSTDEQNLTTHEADSVSHITAAERNSWNSKETPTGSLSKIEQNSYETIKSNKDGNGIYTTVQQQRKSDGTLVRQSVLSGGTSPQYTTRTVTYYAADGATVVKTDTFTLTYDADGDLVSEV
jgi:hypothetical protein